jgi:RNA polymerase primary sigma factor
VVERGDDWVDDYIRRAGSLRPIGRAEAAQLATLAQSGDREAEQILFDANLRLVVNLAKRYVRNDSLGRLFQLGESGLRRAIVRFESSKGFSFTTYATWWIKQAIVSGGGEGDNGGRVGEPRHPLPSVGGVTATAQRS